MELASAMTERTPQCSFPPFPSSCPYVTTVGETHDFGSERIVERPVSTTPDGVKHGDYVAGGSFSNYSPHPAYQKKVVDGYFKSLKGAYKGLCNSKGRAYPDLSAQALYFAYFWNQTESNISGTSASIPLMSGIISLVNDALISSVCSVLGFLNPWLYKKGYQGLADITIGSVLGCETAGFLAAKGWDAASGFVTSVFPQLVKFAK